VSRLVIGTDVIRVERQRAGLHQAEHHHVRAVLRVDVLTELQAAPAAVGTPALDRQHHAGVGLIGMQIAGRHTPGKVTIAACTSMSTPNDGQ
jgi:hypothetical protein